MLVGFKQKIKTMIDGLNDSSVLVEAILIPIILFVLDFLLRAIMDLGLQDTGADMALLATAALLTLLMDLRNTNLELSTAIFLFLLFMIPWVICLWLIKKDNHEIVQYFSLPVGLFALFISGIVIDLATSEKQL